MIYKAGALVLESRASMWAVRRSWDRHTVRTLEMAHMETPWSGLETKKREKGETERRELDAWTPSLPVPIGYILAATS